MNARLVVRLSIVAAVLGAVLLFFAVGFRRVAPPAPAPAAPSQSVR